MSFSTEMLGADIMREHRATWFVWAGGQKMPHTAQMRGWWGWDATCSCGKWESRTGGATRKSVEDDLFMHRLYAKGDKERASAIVQEGAR